MSLMTPNETAKFCSTNFSTLFDWFDLGAIPAPLLVAGHVRWRRQDLERWTAEGCPAGPRPKKMVFYRVHCAACKEIIPIEIEKEEKDE